MATGRTPIYQKITRYLVTEVLPALQEGAELPTTPELCDRFGARGVQTVRNGVQPLVDAGYVQTRYRPTRRWVVRKPLPPITPAESGTQSASLRGHLDTVIEGLATTKATLRRALADVDAQLVALKQARRLADPPPPDQSEGDGTSLVSPYRSLDELADALIWPDRSTARLA